MTDDQQWVNPFGVPVGAPLWAVDSAREVVNEIDAVLFDDLWPRIS